MRNSYIPPKTAALGLVDPGNAAPTPDAIMKRRPRAIIARASVARQGVVTANKVDAWQGRVEKSSAQIFQSNLPNGPK
jgi:hypothetical protein